MLPAEATTLAVDQGLLRSSAQVCPGLCARGGVSRIMISRISRPQAWTIMSVVSSTAFAMDGPSQACNRLQHVAF